MYFAEFDDGAWRQGVVRLVHHAGSPDGLWGMHPSAYLRAMDQLALAEAEIALRCVLGPGRRLCRYVIATAPAKSAQLVEKALASFATPNSNVPEAAKVATSREEHDRWLADFHPWQSRISGAWHQRGVWFSCGFPTLGHLEELLATAVQAEQSIAWQVHFHPRQVTPAQLKAARLNLLKMEELPGVSPKLLARQHDAVERLKQMAAVREVFLGAHGAETAQWLETACNSIFQREFGRLGFEHLEMRFKEQEHEQHLQGAMHSFFISTEPPDTAELCGFAEPEEEWRQALHWSPPATLINRLVDSGPGPRKADVPPVVDFVILTALEEEREAVLAYLPGYRQLPREGNSPHTYYEAMLTTDDMARTSYRILVTGLTGGMGPTLAAAKAAAIVSQWHPRYVLLVGIAAGVASVAQLGDVLVASQIVDYTVGKRVPGERIPRWAVYPADRTLLDAATNFRGDWQAGLRVPRPGADTHKSVRRIGSVLSGGDVLADGETLQESRKSWDKLVGAEMEGGGAALALCDTAERTRFLMIRGVSDLADISKNSHQEQGWREYACHAAAAYAIALLKSGPVPPAAVQG